jgi:manganese/iron transport system ATP-binding protein/manganese/zinc/iron transport system ATP- binding protein
MSLVEVSGLVSGYDPGRPVLSGVGFTLDVGQAIAVLGPNGGGKTTLLRVLLGELPVLAGTCRVEGRPAYVAQSGRARLDFPVSALDVTLMGAYARTPAWRRLGRTERARARAMLERVGMDAQAGTRFGALSGGQRQRVLIARALLQDAPVLLLDEPFTGVDRTSEAGLLTILDELRGEGRGLLVSTHDIEHARRWDRVLCLNGAQVAFGTPADALTPQALHATYGEEMVTLGEETVTVHSHHHD